MKLFHGSASSFEPRAQSAPVERPPATYEHPEVSPASRGNVPVQYYDAGHMMHLHAASMQNVKRDLASFVDPNGG